MNQIDEATAAADTNECTRIPDEIETYIAAELDRRLSRITEGK